MCRRCSRRSVVRNITSCILARTLLTNIPEGVYHLPSFLSPEAKGLINGMLAVDPVKRITIPEIMQHPFFTIDLPNYLSPMPQQGPVLGTLSSLVAPPKVLDFDFIEGLGRIEDEVVEELASRMDGVDKEDIWECLRRDDGPQGNAVKVAYMLLRDKRRAGRNRESGFLQCSTIVGLSSEQWRSTKSRSGMRSWLLWT